MSQIRCPKCFVINESDKDGVFKRECLACHHLLPNPHTEEGENPQSNPFGLSEYQLKILLDRCLKPEEISGESSVQHDRVSELICWFHRFAAGQHANPKWFQSHAFELVYYIATNSVNRFVDLEPVRLKAYKEGAMITPGERMAFTKLGLLPEQPLPPEDTAVWQEMEIPKMSDELAGLSDMAAIEYGKENTSDSAEYDYSAMLTEAHEAGQSWMYRKMLQMATDANQRYSDAVLDIRRLEKEKKELEEWIHSHQ